MRNELKDMEEFETSRKTQFNKDRKKQLIEMEHIGHELCDEHSKVIHQIEHINWHLSHAHPHEITTPIELPTIPPRICHPDGIISGHGHGHIHGRLHCTNKPSANMVKFTEHRRDQFNTWVNCSKIFHLIFSSKGLSPNQRRTIDQNYFWVATQNMSS